MEGGTIWVTVHLLDETGGWEGKVYDIHILVDGELVYEENFDEPLVVCVEYEFPIPYDGTDFEEIMIHLTGKEHENLGQHPSSPRPPG